MNHLPFLYQISFYSKVIDNKFLSLLGIFPHVVRKNRIDRCFFERITGSKRMSSPIKFLNSSGEISPNPFESCYFWISSEFSNCISSLFIRVTVNRFLLISNTEQRCLQNIHVISFDQIRKEL